MARGTTRDYVGPSEVQYYARDYVGLYWAPIPTCYDIAYAAARRWYHILMDDLSATHRDNRKATPTLAYGQAVADALAALHAYRWGDGRLREIGAAVPGVGEIDRYMAHIAPGLAPILHASTEDIDPS
jgi:hypothetical protein